MRYVQILKFVMDFVVLWVSNRVIIGNSPILHPLLATTYINEDVSTYTYMQISYGYTIVYMPPWILH